MTYCIKAPETPGAQPAVIASRTDLPAARKAARAFSRSRRDLRGQDVRIEREDGSLVEYAGIGS